MRDPLIDPIAHIREEAINLTLRQIAQKVRPLLRRQADGAMEIGAYMDALFSKVTGGARKDFLRQNFNIGERQAWKYVRAHRNRDTIRENYPELDALSPTLAEAMRILEEDAAPGDETPATADVPYASNGKPSAPTEPAREPGDEKDYDNIAAKIHKALCPRCTRLKGPSCQKCRSMAYRIEHGSETPSKPPANGKHKEDPNNGRVLFEWARYRKSKTEFLACIDSLAKGYGKEFTPERAAFDRLLLQLDTQVKEAYKKWAKQEPPQFS